MLAPHVVGQRGDLVREARRVDAQRQPDERRIESHRSCRLRRRARCHTPCHAARMTATATADLCTALEKWDQQALPTAFATSISGAPSPETETPWNDSIFCCTWSGVSDGHFCLISATAATTNGVDIDVPLSGPNASGRLPTFGVGKVERIALPGAPMST